MKNHMYQFVCPECGVNFIYLISEDVIAEDTSIPLVCFRFNRPAGCGKAIMLKPSQGYAVGISDDDMRAMSNVPMG